MSSRSASDSVTVTDSTPKIAVGGTGNVGIGASDSVTITESLVNDIPTIVINPTFRHLRSNDLFKASVGQVPNRERTAVLDITFGSAMTYTTGGIVLNFSKIQRFKTVYLCTEVHSTSSLYTEFKPDTNNNSKYGKLKFYDTNGSELANGSSKIAGVVIRAKIRGN